MVYFIAIIIAPFGNCHSLSADFKIVVLSLSKGPGATKICFSIHAIGGVIIMNKR